ncbi:MAG: linear amide C-N hydrolase [Bacteroidetes bacterium]|nr:linear amide C-N hydrolase [Bacteroidota bacterium]
MHLIKYHFTLLLFIGVTHTAHPCSSFVLKNEKTILLGKNFDWTFDQGYLIKNIRNTTKVAYFSHNGQPASWTSKYGSITFNQNGKEMPYGGMNEKGLVVEMLWLDDIRFNISENKPYLNELEWIQYQLDNFENIKEVIAQIDIHKIYPVKGKIHYILADASGNSVIIEYLDGIPNIYEKEGNTCQAITNRTVNYSEKNKDNMQDFPKRNTSEMYRYHQIEKDIKQLQDSEDFSEKSAFEILKNVSITKGNFKTVWSIVYNIENKSISFFSHSDKKLKRINLNNLDFEHTISYFDINQNTEIILDGKLQPINYQANFEAMSASLTHLDFDINLSKELSAHQMNQTLLSVSYFSQNYFHFDIRIPLEEAGNRFIFAVMDNEENFKNRSAVTGGYLLGTTVIGVYNCHIYGLKNGNYSMIALIDLNRNSQLDFDSNGNPIEPYATFNEFKPKSMEEITFQNTSGYFDIHNSNLTLEWK